LNVATRAKRRLAATDARTLRQFAAMVLTVSLRQFAAAARARAFFPRRARVLVLGLALAAGCAFPVPPPQPTLDGFPLDRFDRVADGIYRSSQPSAKALAALKSRYGLQTIIKLNHGSDAAPAGVRVINEGLDALVEPPRATLERILDEIDRSPKPVLIHCTHGEDRTGLIVALYKMRHGEKVESAYADMMRHRFHPYRGIWRAWLKFAGWDRPQLTAAN
jgi:hypothetical protein